ncbi:MAG: hypothetical protein CME24_06055 [Gemmatimonadetes bacterium]|nr:hypothetical protein [Gemmatimonadota bacterium]
MLHDLVDQDVTTACLTDVGAGALVAGSEMVPEPGVLLPDGLRRWQASTMVSKNQVVCPRFHAGGPTSGADWS